MKKHTFIESTIIATISIVLVKVLGMLYVIPFYAIVGSTGAALYSYAYNIYGLFLEISTAGIPNAIGKLINELNTLNKQEAKMRTFKLGKRLLGIIALVAFLIMFIFAPQLASLILGKISGGNSISDITFVIRCVSFALLIFPFLSITRGFFQGHGIIYVSSFSQVIEQLVRVLVIICGSYIAVKWLNLDLAKSVGIAVFGAFIGGACALSYVHHKLKKHQSDFHLEKEYEKKDEITNKEIIKKIFKYAIPTVIISIAFSIYNNIDMVLILRTMDHLGFSALDAEFISSAISTWASKISIIITSIGLGLAPGLVAAMVEASTLKKYLEVNHKFNKALELMLFITLPMCIGISLLSASIWTVFYGYNILGTKILTVCIFAPLFSNLFTIANYTLQSLNRFKMVYISAISGIVINTILDVPLMLLLNALGLPAYWGATLATMIGLSFTFIFALIVLKKTYNFQYHDLLSSLKQIIIPLLLMIVVVIILKSFIPINYASRFSCIIYISIIALLGALTYFFVSYKLGLVTKILGADFLTKLKNKFFKKNKKA